MHRSAGRRADLLLFAQRPRVVGIFRPGRLHQARTARSIRPPFVRNQRFGFPTGASKISTHGYDPYIQFPWSRRIDDDWSVHGMFTVAWFTHQHKINPTFEPTLSIERELGPTRDLFVEYVGDYPNHARPSQILDSGASWRVTRLEQLDFHLGFGLNSTSVDHFLGIGYSFRLDSLIN